MSKTQLTNTLAYGLLTLLLVVGLEANSADLSVINSGYGSNPVVGQTSPSDKSDERSDPVINSATASNIQTAGQDQSTTPSLQNSQTLPENNSNEQAENQPTIIKDGVTYPNRTYKTLSIPNDPSANQWWVAPNVMSNVWDIPAGSRQTKVAVIDTGFALNHQEFTGRWAINAGEFGSVLSEAPSDLNCTDHGLALNKSCNNIDDNFDGIVDNEIGATSKQNPSKLNCTDQGIARNKNCNNIDDDTNGYVDDYRGFDFANFDANSQAGEINPTGSGTTHGTKVAGVLGATGNNGVGTAGVNWHTSILPIQALDDDGYGDSYTVGEAIYYAADQGVDVISLSLGTSSDDPYLRRAILYALDRGILVVAASGNDGCNCISYPANYPEVIAVGAIAPNGNPASFSSYGAQLDILAPGQSMFTSTYSSTNQTSAYASSVAGTSFSTPFVSGLLALGRMAQPNANWEEIIGAMFENSDRRTLTASSPRSDTLGYGVVRSNTMLNRLLSTPATIQRYQFGGGTILGSSNSYACESTLPASPFYELTKSGQYEYTTNLRSLSIALQSGWTSQQINYVCMGLPTDNIGVLRVLDLPSELRNTHTKQ